MWSTITFLCHTVYMQSRCDKAPPPDSPPSSDVSCVLHIHRLFTITSKSTFRTEFTPTLLQIKSLAVSSTTMEMQHQEPITPPAAHPAPEMQQLYHGRQF